VAILNGNSTLAEVRAAYDDNASYEEERSIEKTKAFITACRILLRRMPQGAGIGGGGYISLSPSTIRDELRAAQRWLASNATAADGGPGARAFSIEGFR
jgi:hypothetical protein